MDNCRTIISFTYPHEAHLAKGYLESNGIETFMENEMTVQANNIWSNAVGGVKLLVKDTDYEQGLLLLKSVGYIKEDGTKPDKPKVVHISMETDKKVCPFCKSDNIGRKKKFSAFMLPFSFIFGVIFPLYKLTYTCFDCGKEWRFKK